MKIMAVDVPVGVLVTNEFATYLNDALSKRSDDILLDRLVNRHKVKLPGNKTYTLGLICILSIIQTRWKEVKYRLADDSTTIEKIVSESVNYNVMLFSAKSNTYNMSLVIAEECKRRNPNLKVIFGGPHSTSLPKEVIAENSIDFVCIGEGEESIIELICAIENNGNYSSIKGIAYKNEFGKVIITEKRMLAEKLDDFPIPNFALLEGDINDYHIYIETGRGCTHDCSFCANPMLWQRKVRKYTPERTYNLLKGLSEVLQKNTLVHIIDPAFGSVDCDYELCRLLEEKPLTLKFSCDICAIDMDIELIEHLVKAGFVMTCIGIENSSESVLRTNKKPVTLNIFKQACKTIREHSELLIKTYWIIGLPGETEESARQNRNTIIEMLKNDEFDICCEHIFIPYPGSKIYDDPDKYNYKIYHKDWSYYDARSFPLPGENIEFSMESAYISYLDILRAECEVYELDKYFNRENLQKQQEVVGFREHKKRLV